MITKQRNLTFLFAVLAFVSGCKNGELDPSSEVSEIASSYKKIETRASNEEIDKQLLRGKEHLEKYTSRYHSARDVSGAGYDVGVVPETSSCPLSSEMVGFYIDNENTGNNTRTNGWKGAWTTETGGDSYLRFCKIDGRLFNNMQGTFGVLKLGPNNPTGFQEVRLLSMDNQDSGWTSIPTGASNAAPNWVDGDNLRLHFTQFKIASGATPTAFPNLGFSYGVMGWTALALETGQYYTDDEDHNNATSEKIVEGTSGNLVISYEFVRINNTSWEVAGTNFRLSKVK